MASQEHVQVVALLAQAQRYEDNGEFEAAVLHYQAAMDLIPEQDPWRDQIQSIIDFIRQTQPARARQPVFEPEEDASRQPHIPLWGWGVAGLGILLAVCLIAAAGYYILSRQSPPIPRLSGLAPTPLVVAPVPTPLATRPAPTPLAIAPAPTAQSPQVQPTPLGIQTPVTPPRSSGNITFQEDFGGSGLDLTRWQLDNSSGTQLQVGGGLLRLASSASHEPYIHTQSNPFPTTGDFRASLRFRFPEIRTCGTAIALTSFVLPAGRSQNETNQLSQSAEQAGGISIWFWHNVLYYRSGTTFEDIAVPGSPMDWRDVAVEYLGGVYRILINGNPLYTSPPTAARPSVLWMGLPFDLGGSGCAWDSLEVNKILIQSLP